MVLIVGILVLPQLDIILIVLKHFVLGLVNDAFWDVLVNFPYRWTLPILKVLQ